ncbi:MAG TPA: TIGR04283 family arsenosugar biosynthesis glycosyltransferase [Verrucomicrobiae bacterium]|nr:TIGR04283 family arsenosugar biosynthesis glycosyltransferase [Verrucomicrobiae bacterium]
MSSQRRSKSWTWGTRLAAVAVTFGLLFIVYRRIDATLLQSAFARVKWGWLILGFAGYGLALAVGGLRSHFALRLTHAASHFLASCRIFLVGHFLFLVLFGAAGGDLAKSAVYSRWFGVGIPQVLAAAPFDRLLGFCGAALLAVGVVAVSVLTGTWGEIERMPMQMTGVWAIAMITAVGLIVIGIILLRPKGQGFVTRTLASLRVGFVRLFAEPRIGLTGLAFASLAQAAASAVFAVNLCAVASQPLPWTQLAWTFPAITILSCMPFTVAGIGSRELVSVALLGMYGVPAADCAAASLLTLLDICVWAMIAAAVFWREELRIGKLGEPQPLNSISVIMPARDEAENLAQTIERLKAIPEIREIIVVDGESRDGTATLAEDLGCSVLRGGSGRGGQMRLGTEHAIGDVLLFVHADSWLPPDAGRAVLECLRDPTVVAGGFWKRFHNSPISLRGSRLKCAIRLLLGRRIAGDQAIFVRRSALDAVGGMPAIPLMEEFELCRRLRKIGRLTLADATIVTSPRRFQQFGVLRTYWRMWWVTTLYRLGRPPHELAHFYDKSVTK